MLEVHALDFNNGSIVAQLVTESRSIAHDFIYDLITESWNGANYKVGLFDKAYGYYAMAIPHCENSISEAFEIMALRELPQEYYCIPDTIDVMLELLED